MARGSRQERPEGIVIRSRRRYRRPDRGRVGSRERRRERWTSEQARTRFGSSAGVWAGNRAADGFANNASHGTARSAPPVNATVGCLTQASVYAIFVCMRTTLNIDDGILKQASQLTGVREKTTLVRMGLEALISRRSAQRLAALGGTEPQAKRIPRRRPPK